MDEDHVGQARLRATASKRPVEDVVADEPSRVGAELSAKLGIFEQGYHLPNGEPSRERGVQGEVGVDALPAGLTALVVGDAEGHVVVGEVLDKEGLGGDVHSQVKDELAGGGREDRQTLDIGVHGRPRDLEDLEE